MEDETAFGSAQERTTAGCGLLARILNSRFTRAFESAAVPFEICLPDRSIHSFGRTAPCFRVALKNRSAVWAFASLDEGRFAGAYLAGDIDIEGDMLRPFELRGAMGDFHVLASAWRFVQPLVFGQLSTNRKAITPHYDIDPGFFLSFLDPKTPCYTQGMYESDHESLDVATLRKFEYCFDRLKLNEPDPEMRTPRTARSVVHGRPVRSLATNREPAGGGQRGACHGYDASARFSTSARQRRSNCVGGTYPSAECLRSVL